MFEQYHSKHYAVDIGTSSITMAVYNQKLHKNIIIPNGDGKPCTSHDVLAENAFERSEMMKTLFARIRREYRHSIDPYGSLGITMEGLTLTCPADVSEEEKELLKRSAQSAGFHVEALLPEPAAAVLAFLTWNEMTEKKKYYRVVDAGAKTLDFALVETEGRRVTVKAVERAQPGGDGVDRLMMEFYARKLAKEGISLKEDIQMQEALRSKVEEAKISLSSKGIEEDTFVLYSEKDAKSYKMKMTKIEYLVLCGLVQKQFLEAADRFDASVRRLGIGHVDTTVLIGGTNCNPFFSDTFRERYADSRVLGYKEREAAALGAAAYARLVLDEKKELIIENEAARMPQTRKESEEPKTVEYLGDRTVVPIQRVNSLGLKNTLDSRLLEAYWSLVYAIAELSGEIEVPIRTDREYYAVVNAIIYDYPELGFYWNYGDTRINARYKKDGVDIWRLGLNYNSTKPEVQRKLSQINQTVEQIVDAVTAKTEFQAGNEERQMIIAVYDHLARRFTYSEKKDGKFPDYAPTLECLLHGDGICAGISSAYTYILKKLQIPSMVIIGYGRGYEGHAWNIVQLSDGRFCHLDLTWDLQNFIYQYLLKDDADMAAGRHLWDYRVYPNCR